MFAQCIQIKILPNHKLYAPTSVKLEIICTTTHCIFEDCQDEDDDIAFVQRTCLHTHSFWRPATKQEYYKQITGTILYNFKVLVSTTVGYAARLQSKKSFNIP